jgi:uncharacterized membrane protein
MILFFLLMVLLVVAVVAYAGGWRPQFGQWSPPGGAATSGSGDALEILRVRYARGDINHEEYLRMREVLQS